MTRGTGSTFFDPDRRSLSPPPSFQFLILVGHKDHFWFFFLLDKSTFETFGCLGSYHGAITNTRCYPSDNLLDFLVHVYFGRPQFLPIAYIPLRIRSLEIPGPQIRVYLIVIRNFNKQRYYYVSVIYLDHFQPLGTSAAFTGAIWRSPKGRRAPDLIPRTYYRRPTFDTFPLAQSFSSLSGPRTCSPKCI